MDEAATNSDSGLPDGIPLHAPIGGGGVEGAPPESSESRGAVLGQLQRLQPGLDNATGTGTAGASVPATAAGGLVPHYVGDEDAPNRAGRPRSGSGSSVHSETVSGRSDSLQSPLLQGTTATAREGSSSGPPGGAGCGAGGPVDDGPSARSPEASQRLPIIKWVHIEVVQSGRLGPRGLRGAFGTVQVGGVFFSKKKKKVLPPPPPPSPPPPHPHRRLGCNKPYL